MRAVDEADIHEPELDKSITNREALLLKQIDKLQQENRRLKSLLIDHGIQIPIEQSHVLEKD